MRSVSKTKARKPAQSKPRKSEMTAEALERLIAERFGVRPVQVGVRGDPPDWTATLIAMAGQRHASGRILIPRRGTARRVRPEGRMIKLTRTSEPEAKSYLFTIDRDGEMSLRLTRPEAIARLTNDVEGAERLVDQATFYGVVIIHEYG